MAAIVYLLWVGGWGVEGSLKSHSGAWQGGHLIQQGRLIPICVWGGWSRVRDYHLFLGGLFVPFPEELAPVCVREKGPG